MCGQRMVCAANSWIRMIRCIISISAIVIHLSVGWSCLMHLGCFFFLIFDSYQHQCSPSGIVSPNTHGNKYVVSSKKLTRAMWVFAWLHYWVLFFSLFFFYMHYIRLSVCLPGCVNVWLPSWHYTCIYIVCRWSTCTVFHGQYETRQLCCKYSLLFSKYVIIDCWT